MSHQKCPECNLINFATAVTCNRCGYQFQEVKKQMPPIRVAGTAVNLTTQIGAIANAKVPPPPVPPHSQVNSPTQKTLSTNGISQQHQVNYTSANSPQNSQTLNQQLSKPQQNQYQPKQNIHQTANQTGNTTTNTTEKNVAIADLAMEANSASLPVKILMLPFTIVKKILGFLYNHKKVAALVLAPPAIAVVVGPNLLEAVKTANENSAIATIKQLNQAQTTFLATKFRCGELKELEQNQLVDSSISSGTKSGYIFTLGSLPGGCEIYAKPTETEGLTATGNRSFYYSTRDNTLRASEDKKVLASASSQAADVGKDMKQEGEKPKIAQK